MALIECNFFSNVLDMSCSISVVLPEAASGRSHLKTSRFSKKYPTLWLLHGMGGDHTTWIRKTSIERYATAAGLAVVMPAVGLSWYQDMAIGSDYGSFVRDELPAVAQSLFPLSSHRKSNFVAGNSMGGYGAFLLAFSQPERFAAAASLSGALDIASNVYGDDRRWNMVINAAFGDSGKIRGGSSDLLYLTRRLVRSRRARPALYACCGSKDFLLANNHAFSMNAKKIGLPFTYEEHVGMDHEWGYWDQQIQTVIRWLPL